jgi:hypothetical protein
LRGNALAREAPNYPPFVITITWAPGDMVDIAYDDLEPWEVMAVLEQCRDMMTASEDEDSEAST